MTMITTMAEARIGRNATAARNQGQGLHDYGSAGEAQVALENSGLVPADVNHSDQMNMARWMWRNDASPEDAAVAFGLKTVR